MKTAKYESSGGALLALLATRSFVFCDLYTITLSSGTVLRYAASDVDVAYSGIVWKHNNPMIVSPDNRPTGHWKKGLDVDTWNLMVIPRAVDPVSGATFPDKIGGVGWLSAARAGALDGAKVEVDRAFFTSWLGQLPTASPTGVVNIFTGEIGDVDVSRAECYMQINSYMKRFDIQMPRNLFQAGCRWTLYDAGCTLNQASFAVSCNVTGVTTNGDFTGAGAPPVGLTFTLGRVSFTTGQNTGFVRTIRLWDGASRFQLLSPFPLPVQVGDLFNAYPGCAKTVEACTAFGNLANFGGEPYIPVPETAI